MVHRTPSTLHRMTKNDPLDAFLHEASWEEKARRNPLYAVMTLPEMADSGVEPSPEVLEFFYADGKEKVLRWIRPWLSETDFAPHMTVLEFGCGTGRLLRALAESHDATKVYGIDVSPTMIEHARRYMPAGTNLALTGVDGTLPFPDAHFDRIYSYAVFQHIASEAIVRKSLREIGRILKPGGHVKLNIELGYSPSFGRSMRKNSFAFRGRTVLYGWSTRFGIPLPFFRMVAPTNWIGIRLSQTQIVEELERAGIIVHGMRSERPGMRFVWFYGYKVPAPQSP